MRSNGRLRLLDVIMLSFLGVIFAGLLLPVSCGKEKKPKEDDDGEVSTSTHDGDSGRRYYPESREDPDRFLSPLARARAQARRVSCLNNLRQISTAMKLYVTDNDRFPELVDPRTGEKVQAVDGEGHISTLPSRTAFALLLKSGCISTPKVFICPASRDRIGPGFPTDFQDADLADLVLQEGECSYGWDPTKTDTGEICALIADKPPDRDLSYEFDGDPNHNSPNHDGKGQNIAYTDGHVKWSFTPKPETRGDADIYKGESGYEDSSTDAKIIR